MYPAVPSYTQLGQEFSRHYFTNFDQNPDSLAGLYFSDSYFTLLGEEVVGYQAYLQRLRSHGVNRLSHRVFHVDTQPVNDQLVLVQAVGEVTPNGFDYNRFAMSFLLVRTQGTSFMVKNQMMRLVA